MSDAKIYLVDPGHKRLMPMHATRYLTEDELQTYLADYDGLLPGDQINPEAPRRWLLVAREMAVPDTSREGGRWSLDHLFLDQDGTPTFVECKRASDTRTRREVVAQMLDYAANGTAYWKVDHLRQAAAETAARRGADLDGLIRELIGPDGAVDVDAFWSEVGRRLDEGQVRLLFVVDQAPSELRRLAEFIWRTASAHACAVDWSATCYSVRTRHPVTGEKLSFLYGYPDHFNFYFEYLALPAEPAASLRRELLDTGLFRPSGRHTLESALVDQHNVQVALAVLDLIFRRVEDALAQQAAP